MPLYTRIDYGRKKPLSVDGYKPSLGESMAAAFRSAWNASPMQSLIDMDRMNEAERPLDPDLLDMDYNELMEHAAAMPEKDARAMSLDEQKRRIDEAGLEGMLKAREGYTGEALEILIEAKKEENRNSLVAASAPGWHMPFTFGAGLAASMLDPINAASAFVPVIGEARLMKMLGSATRAAAGPGKALLARSGIRAATGAASGLVGAAAVEPLTMLGQQTLQADYGMADSLLNLGFGAVFGAAFHAGFGALGEWKRKKAGMPQAWEYVPETEESAEYLRLHADNILRAYEDLVNGMSPEELANSRLAGKSMEELRANALGTAIIYDSWARHYSYATQKPVGDFYRNYIIDYQSGELAPGNALEGMVGGDSFYHAMYKSSAGDINAYLQETRNSNYANNNYFHYRDITSNEKKWPVEIGFNQVRHIDKRHPEFNGWENIPDVIEKGKRLFGGNDRYTNSPAYIYLLDEGSGKTQVVIAAEVKGNARKGRPDRHVVLTSFTDDSDSVAAWSFKYENTASPSDKDRTPPGERGTRSSLPSKDGPLGPQGGNLEKKINGIEKEVKELFSKDTSGDKLNQPELGDGGKPQAVESGEDPQSRRLAGEVEAGERRASLVESAEDVPGHEQVVVNDDGIAAMIDETSPRIAEVVEIDPSLLIHEDGSPVNLLSRSDMILWLRKNLQGKIISIADDGTVQKFTRAGLDASLKRRGLEHSQAYANLDIALEKALYEGFEKADSRHAGKVKGQNVYYSAIKIGSNYYAVRFKVDIPEEKGWKAYKDHKVTQIEIAPSPYPVPGNSSLDKRNQSAISGISLAILKGDVKPSRIENNILYQSPASRPNALGGNATSIQLGEGAADPAHYEVWELEDIIASHDPVNGFRRRENYPAIAQERPYHSDVGEQGKVLANARVYRPDYVLNTDPTAQNGPPVITKKGIVLGGNSRAMTLDLVYSADSDQARAYKNMLVERAGQFGLDGEAVAAMRHPVLARVLDGEFDLADMVRKSREYNQTTTQKLRADAEAVSRGRMVGNDTLNEIAAGIEKYDGLANYLGTLDGRKLVDSFLRDGVITQTEYSSLTNSMGAFNDEGKALVAKVIRGLAVPDADTLALLTARQLDTLDRIAPITAVLRSRGPDWDLSRGLVEALRLSARARMAGKDLSVWLAQGMLAGLGERRNPLVEALALTMENAGWREVRARFEMFSREAEHGSRKQASLFGGTGEVKPAEAFRRAFLEPCARVGELNVEAFNAGGNDLHKAIFWAVDNGGGKKATVEKALERLGKKLASKKIGIDEKAELKGIQASLAPLAGKIEIFEPGLGRYFRADAELEIPRWDGEPARSGPEAEGGMAAAADGNVAQNVDINQFRSARASVSFVDEGHAIVTFFKSADLTSAPHELYHIIRRQMELAATGPKASPGMRELWGRACDFVGAKPGEAWSLEMEEKFARAGERYLLEGIAPNARLAPVMEQMKERFMDVYADVEGAGLEISDGMRETFSRMFSMPVDQADLQFRLAVGDIVTRKWENEFYDGGAGPAGGHERKMRELANEAGSDLQAARELDGLEQADLDELMRDVRELDPEFARGLEAETAGMLAADRLEVERSRLLTENESLLQEYARCVYGG